MSNTGAFYTIQAFNPHEATHLGHKVVSEETLTLIKLLREQGNRVLVEPDDGRPVEYLFRKGFTQFFSDPLVIGFGLGVASSVVATIITNGVNWIWQHRRKEHIFMSAPKYSNILLKNTADESLFSYTGEPLESAALDRLLSSAQQIKDEFRLAARSRSKYPELKVPIFLEHTAQLVGWCDLEYKEGRLFSEHVYIFDKVALLKVKRGDLRGMSIAGIAKESICSICRSSYIECNHIGGVTYGSDYCHNTIKQATLINVNLVARPINQDCYIPMMDRVNRTS